MSIEKLRAWAEHGQIEDPSYCAGNADFANDVIALLARLTELEELAGVGRKLTEPAPGIKLFHITKPSQLEVGKTYILVGATGAFFSELKKHPSEDPYFENRIWASERNPQAFERWEIWGPINASEYVRKFRD